MRDRIELRSFSTTKGVTGSAKREIIVLDTVWADIRAIRGSEDKEASRLTTIQGYLIKIYSRNDITTQSFIRWNDCDLQIKSISDRWKTTRETKGMFLTLECIDGVQS